MSQSPSVLMILNDIAWFWSHRLPLAQAILDKGWTLSVATAQASKDDGLKKMNVRGYDLADHGSSFNPLAQITILLSIQKTIRDLRPDIIHAITLRHAFFAGLVTRLIGYKPIIFTIAGLGSLFSAQDPKTKTIRTLARPLLQLAFRGKGRFIIFQNPDDQKAMVEAGIVDPSQTTIIRGSGVNISEFTPTPIPNNQPPIILFTSRLIAEKGIYDFVEAARILKKKNIPARFQVAGDFYPKNPHSVPPETMDQWVKNRLIEWLGQVSDMVSVMHNASMVVLPSYYGEGVPKVLLEAAASGRPIITCDLPGCRETITDKVTGLFVPPQNPQELANAIEALLADVERCQEMGQAGRRRVETDFTSEIVVEKTLDVYDQMMEKRL